MVKVERFTFLAGEYWIGDPCYAVKDENWLPLLDETGYFGHDYDQTYDYLDGLFHYNGKECFGGSTAYGDGCYHDKQGRQYGVDAGLLAIIPLSACDGGSMDGGHIVDFDSDFSVWIDGGTFHFGHVVIKTD